MRVANAAAHARPWRVHEMRAIERAWNRHVADVAQVEELTASSSGATARRSNTR